MKCPTCDTELSSPSAVCERCTNLLTASLATTQPSATMATAAMAQTSPWHRGASAAIEADVGAVLANRYRILERVGAGGMGAVYKVLDLTLDKIVALKTVHSEMADDPKVLESFKKELILARQVTHKNVCRVFDLGEDHGNFFLTMEFVEGHSLRSLTKGEQKCAPAKAAEIMLQVATGLEAAHETGIIHRDLKPDNIMVQADGRVLVMDFGIARPVVDAARSFAGTPAYASPEQLLAQKQDSRSDLYSFGLIFFELLCGDLPFPAPRSMSKARERASMAAPAAIEREPSVPRVLSDIIARCLALRPEERFANARELAAAIQNWLHPKPVYAKPAFTWSTAVVIILAAVGGVIWINRPPPPAPPPVSVLISDFENKTGEAVINGTLEPALQAALEGASFITAYDRGAAKRLIAQLRPSQPKLDAAGARLVAEREGVAAVLSGTVEHEGPRYRLAVRIVNPVDGKPLVKEQQRTVTRDHLLSAAAAVAAPVRRALGDRTPTSKQIAASETFTTASLEAANRYSAAQEFQYVGERERAAQAYQEAIRLDPNMGRAYAGLAVVSRNLNRPAEALKYYELALSHSDRMSEREKLRTRGGYNITANNPGKAAEEFGTLVKEFPSDTGGHSNLALALLMLRQTARAVEEGRRSVEIYPKNLQNRDNLALYAMYAGDYQTASREASEVLKQNPQFAKAYIALALSALAQGDARQAQDWYEKLGAVSPTGASMSATGLADLAVVQGRLNDAAKILERGIAADEAPKNTVAAAQKYADLAEVYVKIKRMRDAKHDADLAVAGTADLGTLTKAALVYIDAGEPAKAASIAAGLREKVGAENQVTAMLIEGYSQMTAAPVEAIDTFTKSGKTLDSWLGHFLQGRANLAAKAYVDAQAEFESCLKRSGEATAVFLDEVPTARLLPLVSYYLAQAEEGISPGAAKESYERFLAFQAPQSEDPLADAARSKLQHLVKTP